MCGREFEKRAVVAVPETAMHQDDGAVAGKYEIGATRQVPAMQSKAKAAAVQTTAQGHLGFCVPAADAAHIEPPLVGCQIGRAHV